MGSAARSASTRCRNCFWSCRPPVRDGIEVCDLVFCRRHSCCLSVSAKCKVRHFVSADKLSTTLLGIDQWHRQCFNSAEKTRVKHDRKNKSNFIGPFIGVNKNRALTPARLSAAGPYPHPVLKVMGDTTRYYRGALPCATASTHLYDTGEVAIFLPMVPSYQTRPNMLRP